MEINNPRVVEELDQMHSNYERALMSNDVETLDLLFWHSPSAIRYGATENLYGIEEIRSFRKKRSANGLDRLIERKEILALGTSFGVINIQFTRVVGGSIRQGRQSQVWSKMEDGWKIVSAHVSLIPQETSYATAVSRTIMLPIAADDRTAVEEELLRITSMAEILMQFPLDQGIEVAAVFQP